MLNGTTNAFILASHHAGGLEDMGMGGMSYHGFGFMHGPMIIGLLILFVVGVVLFWRCCGKSMCGSGANRSALATLSERFAKGEIDEDEFRSKRAVLKSKK